MTGAVLRPPAVLGDLLDVVDGLAARRPVAARLMAMTRDDAVGSAQLAAALTADVVLTARVLRLANSAYYGMGGRVGTLPFAVTVVGFSTIRAMAATAAAGLDVEAVLPAGFGPRCRATAVASSELAPAFAVPAAEAFCLGLLSGLGQAVLAQHDPEGYRELLDDDAVVAGGRPALLEAELRTYGLRHTEVSAAVLSSWSFPHDTAEALHLLDDPDALTTPWSSCLATAVEAACRLDDDAPGRSRAPRDALELSHGSVTEERLAAVLPRLREAASASDW